MVHIQKIIMKKEVDNEEHGNQQGQGQCGVEQSLKMKGKCHICAHSVDSEIRHFPSIQPASGGYLKLGIGLGMGYRPFFF